MKKNTLIFTMLLFCTMIFALLPTDAECKIYDDTLRLHIPANSDEKRDQEVKILVRDRLLSEYGELLKSADSIGAAMNITEDILTEIEESVNVWLSEYDCDYTSRVSLTREWYDTRQYEDFTLPKGYYNSLKVTLGAGDGKNWWCVMYPPLCTDIATEPSPKDDAVINYSKEELILIKGGKYNVKFKILETLSEAFRKNG